MTSLITHRLSVPTMLAFGFGQISEAIKNSGFNVFLLFYYNQVLGVSATATSIALAVALIFDAVSDPIAGSLSDKLQSRWGRRHPFIFIAAFPLAISFYLLFNPPELSQTGYVIWLLSFAVLVRASMTLYHVPHLALGAEMATDYDQRSTLFGFSTFFALMGGAAFLPLSYRLFFPTTEEFNPALLNQAAYGPWAIFAGVIMILAILVCVYGTRGEIPRLRDRVGPPRAAFGGKQLFVEVKAIFANQSFRAIFFGMILTTFILSVEAVFNPFMGFHFWRMTTEQLSYVPLGALVGLMTSLLLVPIMTRHFDKKPTLIGCALLIIININLPIVLTLLDVSWFPAPGSTALLIVLIVGMAVTTMLAPVLFASLNSMFADIADEHELEVGERREGVIFAARAFAAKASGSLGLIVGGILLDAIAFPRGVAAGEVPEDIVWQLGFIVGPATSIVTFFGMALYLRYRITRARHVEIVALLEARLKSQTSEATDEKR